MSGLNDYAVLSDSICKGMHQAGQGDILFCGQGWAARMPEGAGYPCWVGMHHTTSLVFPKTAESGENYGYRRFVQAMAGLVERYAPEFLKKIGG